MSILKKFLLGAVIVLIVGCFAIGIYTQSVVDHRVFDIGDGQSLVCEIRRSGGVGRCFPAEGEIK